MRYVDGPMLRVPRHRIEVDDAIGSGDRVAVVPRDAASVILLDESEGVRAFLLVRHATLAFAPRMAVFPGGGVDPRDFDDAVPLVGPSAAEWASRLGVTAAEARSLLCAAVRETFEETGVLLAAPSDGSVVDPQDPAWQRTRRALEAHERSFADVVAEHGLALRADLITPWARWTTPRFEERRYRVWFFVARLPPGQAAEAVSTESASGSWLLLDDAVAAADDGTLAMLPPQYFSLAELRADGVPAPGPHGGRPLPVVEPVAVRTPSGATLGLPEQILRYGA